MGVVFLVPGFLRCWSLGRRSWGVEGGLAVASLVAAVFFHLSLGKLTKREKILP
jgi:hypothetical protein